MKLLYGDQTICSSETMKRLAVLANEVCFSDRPSVSFGQGGTIGHPSPMRQFKSDGEAVKLTVFEAATGPTKEVYLPYLQADVSNQAFIATVLEGLEKSTIFADKLLQLRANYGDGITGAHLREAIVKDKSLAAATYIAGMPGIEGKPELFFRPEPAEARITTLNAVLFNVSILLTNTMLLANEHGAHPVSDDKYFGRLLAMRSSSPSYIKGTTSLTPYLGLEILKTVIPDDVLQTLTMKDILGYRRAARDAYAAWETEINKLAAKIEDLPFEKAQGRIQQLIATEVKPEITKLQNEMITARDQCFGDLIKNALKIDGTRLLPTLSVAWLTTDFASAVATFAATTLPTLAPPIIKCVTERRAIRRKHAISYVIGLARPS